MSEQQEYIDQNFTFILNHALTQAEVALCLALTDDIHITQVTPGIEDGSFVVSKIVVVVRRQFCYVVIMTKITR